MNRLFEKIKIIGRSLATDKKQRKQKLPLLGMKLGDISKHTLDIKMILKE